jgi:mercuric ion transport protein
MNGTMQDTQPATSERSRRWSLAASVSSIISAFIASICCVAPLVFALLGIGGAGLLVKFEPYRPHFIVVTFALLGTGFYLTYRKPKAAAATTEVEGGPECACPPPTANRAGKIMLWVATVLVLGLLGFPDLAPYLFG